MRLRGRLRSPQGAGRHPVTQMNRSLHFSQKARELNIPDELGDSISLCTYFVPPWGEAATDQQTASLYGSHQF